jgi:hypothetical protein
VEIILLMSFKHLRMVIILLLNALKLLTAVPVKLLNFQKPQKISKKFPKKPQVEGDISLESFEGDLSPIPPLVETVQCSLKGNSMVQCEII